MTQSDGEKTHLTPTPKPQKDPERHKGKGCFLRHITMISRLTGIAVLAVLWSATVTTLKGQFKVPLYVGYYLLAASILITFFESTWILDKLACCIREGCCCRFWAIILWVDGWVKTIIYSALSIPLFIQGTEGLIHIASGFCLLILAILYLVKSVSNLRRKDHEPIPGDTLPEPVTAAPVVVTLETSTQSDVTAVSMEHTNVSTQTTKHPRNPFEDADIIDLDEEAVIADGSAHSKDTRDHSQQVTEQKKDDQNEQ